MNRRVLDLLIVLLPFFVAAASGGALGQEGSRYRSPVFNDVERKENIVFRTATTRSGISVDLRLDVYLPAGDNERARPAILWIHGGGFRPGNDKTQTYIVRMATEFARRGYVCVSTDYRVRERPDEDRKATLQDALDDCRAALAWLRENSQAYGVNPARIAIGGGSAGGMVAVNLASVENDAARKSGVFALMDLWGSPNSLLMPDEIGTRFPPTVIVHGTADQSVAFGQSEQLAARLKEKGVRHLLHPIPGAAHTPMEHMDEIIDVTAKFLYSALVAA